MTGEERARMEGFFDGLMGRGWNLRVWEWGIDADAAYEAGYRAGTRVWRRPRRPRPPRNASLARILETEAEAVADHDAAVQRYGGESTSEGKR